jgi:hypothetical protein
MNTNTSLKMILAATAIAVLASPVMAQKTSPDEKQVPKVEDCVHIPFPSCGDSPLPGLNK